MNEILSTDIFFQPAGSFHDRPWSSHFVSVPPSMTACCVTDGFAFSAVGAAEFDDVDVALLEFELAVFELLDEPPVKLFSLS